MPQGTKNNLQKRLEGQGITFRKTNGWNLRFSPEEEHHLNQTFISVVPMWVFGCFVIFHFQKVPVPAASAWHRCPRRQILGDWMIGCWTWSRGIYMCFQNSILYTTMLRRYIYCHILSHTSYLPLSIHLLMLDLCIYRLDLSSPLLIHRSVMLYVHLAMQSY